MTSFTDEETTQERVKMLGEEPGVFTRNLEKQLFSVRNLWKIYVGLFGANKERVDLLNACSGITSFYIERTMREAAILSICRMTDPKQGRPSKQEKNVTVRRLSDYLSHGYDQELTNLIQVAVDKAEFARTYRNKKLAHSDDDAMNGRILAHSGSRNDMREAMDAIAACVNRFMLVELNTTLATHPISQLSNDEVEFLQVLYHGRIELDRRENESREIARSGDWKASRELMELPNWLTFRPDDELDV